MHHKTHHQEHWARRRRASDCGSGGGGSGPLDHGRHPTDEAVLGARPLPPPQQQQQQPQQQQQRRRRPRPRPRRSGGRKLLAAAALLALCSAAAGALLFFALPVLQGRTADSGGRGGPSAAARRQRSLLAGTAAAAWAAHACPGGGFVDGRRVHSALADEQGRCAAAALDAAPERQRGGAGGARRAPTPPAQLVAVFGGREAELDAPAPQGLPDVPGLLWAEAAAPPAGSSGLRLACGNPSCSRSSRLYLLAPAFPPGQPSLAGPGVHGARVRGAASLALFASPAQPLSAPPAGAGAGGRLPFALVSELYAPAWRQEGNRFAEAALAAAGGGSGRPGSVYVGVVQHSNISGKCATAVVDNAGSAKAYQPAGELLGVLPPSQHEVLAARLAGAGTPLGRAGAGPGAGAGAAALRALLRLAYANASGTAVELWVSGDGGRHFRRNVISPVSADLLPGAGCGGAGHVQHGVAVAVGSDQNVFVAWVKGPHLGGPGPGGSVMSGAAKVFVGRTSPLGLLRDSPRSPSGLLTHAHMAPPAGLDRLFLPTTPALAVDGDTGRVYVAYVAAAKPHLHMDRLAPCPPGLAATRRAASGRLASGAAPTCIAQVLVDTEVLLSYSDDGGATWSAPRSLLPRGGGGNGGGAALQCAVKQWDPVLTVLSPAPGEGGRRRVVLTFKQAVDVEVAAPGARQQQQQQPHEERPEGSPKPAAGGAAGGRDATCVAAAAAAAADDAAAGAAAGAPCVAGPLDGVPGFFRVGPARSMANPLVVEFGAAAGPNGGGGGGLEQLGPPRAVFERPVDLCAPPGGRGDSWRLWRRR